jgi:hypothetical protein
MILYIAHRGNINGINKGRENTVEYILEAINKGFDCEIDVRYIDNKLYLGHDTPDYEINLAFLLNNSSKLWVHCKNLEALNYLIDYKELNIFWHQNDDYTITSKGYIWAYPHKETLNNCIIVMPEWHNYVDLNSNCKGICSDFVESITHHP